MKKIKVMSIFGTRPDAVKMAPLVKEINRRKEFEGIICVSGQHREMLDQVLDIFGITPDIDLGLMKPGQELGQFAAAALTAIEAAIKKENPDIVLVHGDTTTCFIGALAAFYAKIPVGHVEAGLRTGNMYSPFPEEENRVLTAHIASLHFAPTENNIRNLMREGISANIYQTGNTVIDALKSLVRDDFVFRTKILTEACARGTRKILLTAHRRENFGAGFENIFGAVLRLAENYGDVEIIYPVHMNPAVADIARKTLGAHERIHLTGSLDVDELHNLISRCYMVLTDSGGLQEEAPSLGVPVLVLRSETERPEAVEAGTVKIAGVDGDVIYKEAAKLLDDAAAHNAMAKAVNPYGDGRASERICNCIVEFFKGKR